MRFARCSRAGLERLRATCTRDTLLLQRYAERGVRPAWRVQRRRAINAGAIVARLGAHRVGNPDGSRPLKETTAAISHTA
jgi:hypothetical protein